MWDELQMVGALWNHLQEIQELSRVWHKGKLNFSKHTYIQLQVARPSCGLYDHYKEKWWSCL